MHAKLKEPFWKCSAQICGALRPCYTPIIDDNISFHWRYYNAPLIILHTEAKRRKAGTNLSWPNFKYAKDTPPPFFFLVVILPVCFDLQIGSWRRESRAHQMLWHLICACWKPNTHWWMVEKSRGAYVHSWRSVTSGLFILSLSPHRRENVPALNAAGRQAVWLEWAHFKRCP